MSTHVIGFRPPDEKWEKMKIVWELCREIGVEPPDEVNEFFEFETPDDSGVEVSISDAVEEWRSDMEDGFQVDIAALPKDLRYIRFYNSY